MKRDDHSTDTSDLDSLLWPLLHAHASLRPCVLCPELNAFHADDILPLWSAVEATLGGEVDAPFFAVPWPGAQALARVVLDGQVRVEGRRVLDLGCGGGLLSVAAATRSARSVRAADVDPLALSTCRALAHAHGVQIHTALAGVPLCDTTAEAERALASSGLLDGIDSLLVGDLVYSRPLGRALRVMLKAAAQRGRLQQVLLADSGRPYFAQEVAEQLPLQRLGDFLVSVPRDIEGSTQRRVRVYEFSLGANR